MGISLGIWAIAECFIGVNKLVVYTACVVTNNDNPMLPDYATSDVGWSGNIGIGVVKGEGK